jgi:catechol 2,3-dioxygenase-like lactoylglutathione lyase family enzyme
MRVSEVHHVAIVVSDLERSAAFYERLLGYRRTLRLNVGGAVTERALGLPPGLTGRSVYLQGPTRIGQLELIEWDVPAGDQVRTDPRQRGPLLISFEVPSADDITRIYERARELGATPENPPETVHLAGYGDVTAVIVRDPDGTMLEFVALPTPEQVRALREQGQGSR